MKLNIQTIFDLLINVNTLPIFSKIIACLLSLLKLEYVKASINYVLENTVHKDHGAMFTTITLSSFNCEEYRYNFEYYIKTLDLLKIKNLVPEINMLMVFKFSKTYTLFYLLISEWCIVIQKPAFLAKFLAKFVGKKSLLEQINQELNKPCVIEMNSLNINSSNTTSIGKYQMLSMSESKIETEYKKLLGNIIFSLEIIIRSLMYKETGITKIFSSINENDTILKDIKKLESLYANKKKRHNDEYEKYAIINKILTNDLHQFSNIHKLDEVEVVKGFIILSNMLNLLRETDLILKKSHRRAEKNIKAFNYGMHFMRLKQTVRFIINNYYSGFDLNIYIRNRNEAISRLATCLSGQVNVGATNRVVLLLYLGYMIAQVRDEHNQFFRAQLFVFFSTHYFLKFQRKINRFEDVINFNMRPNKILKFTYIFNKYLIKKGEVGKFTPSVIPRRSIAYVLGINIVSKFMADLKNEFTDNKYDEINENYLYSIATMVELDYVKDTKQEHILEGLSLHINTIFNEQIHLHNIQKNDRDEIRKQNIKYFYLLLTNFFPEENQVKIGTCVKNKELEDCDGFWDGTSYTIDSKTFNIHFYELSIYHAVECVISIDDVNERKYLVFLFDVLIRFFVYENLVIYTSNSLVKQGIVLREAFRKRLSIREMEVKKVKHNFIPILNSELYVKKS